MSIEKIERRVRPKFTSWMRWMHFAQSKPPKEALSKLFRGLKRQEYNSRDYAE